MGRAEWSALAIGIAGVLAGIAGAFASNQRVKVLLSLLAALFIPAAIVIAVLGPEEPGTAPPPTPSSATGPLNALSQTPPSSPPRRTATDTRVETSDPAVYYDGVSRLPGSVDLDQSPMVVTGDHGILDLDFTDQRSLHLGDGVRGTPLIDILPREYPYRECVDLLRREGAGQRDYGEYTNLSTSSKAFCIETQHGRIAYVLPLPHLYEAPIVKVVTWDKEQD